MNEEEISKPLDNLSGAAVRGEAVAESNSVFKFIPTMTRKDEEKAANGICPACKVMGLKLISMAHGMSFFQCNNCRDITVLASPRAADAPSEPSDAEIVAIARRAIRDGNAMWDQFEKDENGKFTLPVLDPKDFMLVRAVLAAVKSRAADALDSQPTESEKAIYWFSCLHKCASMLGLDKDESIPSGVVNAVRKLTGTLINEGTKELVSQPAASARQESIGDDAQFDLLMICWFKAAPGAESVEAKARLVAYIDSRAPAAQAASAWQSIETAPCTGCTVLLGCFNSMGKWRTMRGQWFTKAEIDQDWEETDGFEAGWYETAEEPDYPNCWAIDPTHWMPLQPAPQQEGSEAGNGCKVPPPGWYCTREAGHDGPCAAWPEAGGEQHC